MSGTWLIKHLCVYVCYQLQGITLLPSSIHNPKVIWQDFRTMHEERWTLKQVTEVSSLTLAGQDHQKQLTKKVDFDSSSKIGLPNTTFETYTVHHQNAPSYNFTSWFKPDDFIANMHRIKKPWHSNFKDKVEGQIAVWVGYKLSLQKLTKASTDRL